MGLNKPSHLFPLQIFECKIPILIFMYYMFCKKKTAKSQTGIEPAIIKQLLH